MRFTYLLILLYFFVFFNCKEQKSHLTKVEGKQIQITDTISPNRQIEAFIEPYRDKIQKDLDSVLAWSKNTYSKTQGDFNTALGNFMADVVYSEGNPIFKSRTGKNIDMVLLNHGGIRAILPEGNVTKRTAYKLMPFENEIVVAALKKPQIDSLILYLSKSKKAHPISNLKLVLDQDYNIMEAKIKEQAVETNKTYYVATSDYLFNGGDNMHFFKTNTGVYNLNYKIRNALIDHFIKADTIKPVIDNRFIQIE